MSNNLKIIAGGMVVIALALASLLLIWDELSVVGQPFFANSVAGPKGQSGQSELAIRELVIRNLILEPLSFSTTPRAGTIYVSFDPARVDPPSGFLDRFSDLDAVMKPISSCPGLFKVSGPSSICSVRIERWINDKLVEVVAERYWGILAAEDYRTKARWLDGRWHLVRPKYYGVSWSPNQRIQPREQLVTTLA